MKIVDFESFKKAINKLDSMAQGKPEDINVFPQKSTSERLKKFFEIADGNPEWNV